MKKKQCVLKYFCLSVSILMGINTMTYYTYANTAILSTSSSAKCIIKDPNHVLSQQAKELIERVFYENFGDMWKKYGYMTQAPEITFIIDDKLVPTDAGGAELGNGVIAFRQNSFSNIGEYTTDQIVHELSHVSQEYVGKTTFQWLAEGLADYITAQYCEYKRSLIPVQYTSGELYDGYLTTAGFLMWLEQKYTGVVMKLHCAFQQGDIKYEIFQILTGKTLADLWKEYSGKTLPSMEQYLLSCSKVSDILKLAGYYEKGYFTGKPDYEKALKYYLKAAESGDINALLGAANIYYFGRIGTADYEKAFELYHKVVDAEITNSVYACNQLGNMIALKQIKNKTQEQAITYFKRSIALDEKFSFCTIAHSAYAMRRLGDLYSDINDPQAVNWYEKAMKNNNLYAQNRLGYFYLEGIFVNKDVQKAYQYFISVFENPDATDGDKYSATTNLGNLFYEQKDSQAILWYEKAAEYGNISCLNRLGDIYIKGVLTERNVKKAKQYLNSVIQNEKASNEQKEYANNLLKSI